MEFIIFISIPTYFLNCKNVLKTSLILYKIFFIVVTLVVTGMHLINSICDCQINILFIIITYVFYT